MQTIEDYKDATTNQSHLIWNELQLGGLEWSCMITYQLEKNKGTERSTSDGVSLRYYSQ
jgi:hypothetical protein